MHTREMMKTIFVNLLKREDSQELLQFCRDNNLYEAFASCENDEDNFIDIPESYY